MSEGMKPTDDWKAFAKVFKRLEGFEPNPRDSSAKMKFDYYKAALLDVLEDSAQPSDSSQRGLREAERQWLQSKLADAEKSLRCREEGESAWRNGTDEEWKTVAKMHGGAFLNQAARNMKANTEARIAAKCRNEVEMFKAVIAALSTPAPQQAGESLCEYCGKNPCDIENPNSAENKLLDRVFGESSGESYVMSNEDWATQNRAMNELIDNAPTLPDSRGESLRVAVEALRGYKEALRYFNEECRPDIPSSMLRGWGKLGEAATNGDAAVALIEREGGL